MKQHIQVGVLSDSDQQFTLHLTLEEGSQIVVTIVYAKFSGNERLNFWEDLYSLSLNSSLPWMVGGDFNMILGDEKKIGGLPVYQQEFEDFSCCINSCELYDVNFSENPFTWWNGRTGGDCIFKIQDRIVFNQLLLDLFGNVNLQYLAGTGLDHAPLLISSEVN